MKKLIILMAVIFAVNLEAQTDNLTKVYCDKNKSTITYSMNHPLHSWTGVNSDITSLILTNDDRSVINQVAVIAKIASFDSDNANRDSHTIEVTEALLYPNITFESDTIIQKNDSLYVMGRLMFHGIEKGINFTVSKSYKKHKLIVDGGFVVKMTDFDIEPPSLMAIETDDEIKIDFHMVY